MMLTQKISYTFHSECLSINLTQKSCRPSEVATSVICCFLLCPDVTFCQPLRSYETPSYVSAGVTVGFITDLSTLFSVRCLESAERWACSSASFCYFWCKNYIVFPSNLTR